MKKICITPLLLLLVINMYAQTQNVDSLVNVLETQKLTTTEKIKLYQEISDQYIERDNDQSIKYAVEGLKLAEKEKNKEQVSGFYNNLGIAYYSKSSYDTALVFLQESLALAIEIENKDQESVVYTSLGNLYRRQTDYNEAISYYSKSMDIAENIGDKNRYAISLVNISAIYRIMGNFEKAIHYLERAEKISKELNLLYLQTNICYNLGLVYRTIGQLDTALEFAKQTLELSLLGGETKFEIGGLFLLAALYNRLHDRNNAFEYARKCVLVAEKYGDKRLLMGTVLGLADIYFQSGDYDECVTLSLKAWNIDSTDLVYAKDISYQLILSYIFLGNKEKTLYFLAHYNSIIEERNAKQYHDALADMEIKYESGKKEIYITTLKAKQKVYFLTGVVIGTLLLLALVFLLFRYRLNVQKRKLSEQQVIQLEQEKKLITTQAVLDGETAERSRLARDLHDGLGGMLSVVKLNLKDMKHFAIMDGADVEHFEKTLGMLDQSIGELRRVAHHIMPESLMRYGLKVSLEDFVHAIPNTHFQYFGDDLRLDNHVEILIYRCAYELINNAVKYAQATAINVQIIMDSGIVSLTVQDDGIGFDPQTVSAGMGLENIRTRLALYNGQITIHSAPNEGTEVCIEVMIR